MNTILNTPVCEDCYHCSYDPDGLWCIKSLEIQPESKPFGRGIVYFRAKYKDNNCGPEAKYFERAPDKMLKARGRLE